MTRPELLVVAMSLLPAGWSVHAGGFLPIVLHRRRQLVYAGAVRRDLHHTSERLPQGLRRVETRSPPRTPQHAPPPHTHYRILETGFLVARMTLYYAGLSRCHFRTTLCTMDPDCLLDGQKTLNLRNQSAPRGIKQYGHPPASVPP